MKTVNTLANLLETIRDIGATRIAIDGVRQSGKSKLADQLSKELSLPSLNVDCFRYGGNEIYLRTVDIAKLKTTTQCAGSFILEGICMAELLVHANLSVDAFVYVKRTQLGKWIDESWLQPRSPLEKHLSDLRAQPWLVPGGTSVPGNGRLYSHLSRYHAEYAPQSNAHVCYCHNDA